MTVSSPGVRDVDTRGRVPFVSPKAPGSRGQREPGYATGPSDIDQSVNIKVP